MFFDAWVKHDLENDEEYLVIPGESVDIYIVDFLIDHRYVIEIDGHEYHKTKEQRTKDYQRERYLMGKGYFVVRFTASEVYVNAKDCVQKAKDILAAYENIFAEYWNDGHDWGERSRNKKVV